MAVHHFEEVHEVPGGIDVLRRHDRAIPPRLPGGLHGERSKVLELRDAPVAEAHPLDAGRIADVESLNRVDVYPLLTGLQVTEVLVDEGDFVEKGTVLARLDDAEIALELEQAKVACQEAEQRLAMASVARKEALERKKSAEIQAKKARKDYDKALKMLEDELIAEEEFETDRLAWEQASSNLDLTQLECDRAGLDLELSRTEVKKSEIAKENTEVRFSRTRIK